MLKLASVAALGFVIAIMYIRSAHRAGAYDLVQWIIGEPVRE